MKILTSSFSIRSKPIRLRGIVEKDFQELNIKLNRKTIRYLSKYSESQYANLVSRVDLFLKTERFERLYIDSPEKVVEINFSELSDSFLSRCIIGTALDLRGLSRALAIYRKQQADSKALNEITPVEEKPLGAPQIFIPDASKILTNDLLFNPECPYPNNEREYREMIRKITDKRGRFPGDLEAPTTNGLFINPSRKKEGVRTYTLRRNGDIFVAQFFNPLRLALRLKNRMIFDFDLLSQKATFDTYGNKGCSYDRRTYYEERFFSSKVVGFIYLGNFPVNFSAITQYETQIEGRSLLYAFIHAVMTLGDYQRMGLTSYSVREILSSIYYRNVWENEKGNLFVDREGKIKNKRLAMWAAAHSGRTPVFHAFNKSFKMESFEIKEPDIIRKAIISDADRRITPTKDRGIRGALTPLNANTFLDRGVYPPHNRYPLDDEGKAIIPQKEKELCTFPLFMELIGGEEGLKNGNSLYIIGQVTFGKIREAKKREVRREGGTWFEQGLDTARGKIVSLIK